ncbi:MAG: AraC family transcriptional regulator [Rhizomicrobium sp.]|nr:AraC family transcriptional regulator [Rhizomicrobium sp.]
MSSAERGWSSISAELRSHPKGTIAAVVPQQIEINIAINGRDDGLVTRLGNGVCQQTRPATGTIWLVPIGVENDVVDIAETLPEVLHLYLPTRPFETLTDDFNLAKSPARSIQYLAGVQDDLIRQIGLSILSELSHETAAGRMLVETSSLMLAALLAQRYSDGWRGPPPETHHRLDNVRLRRVLDYIDENADSDISVQELAEIACLSPFHFTRMFTAAMGLPPARFVSQQRLENAKAMLARGKLPLSEIALSSRFSSQASFNRAFRRATGMTPGEYQQQLR